MVYMSLATGIASQVLVPQNFMQPRQASALLKPDNFLVCETHQLIPLSPAHGKDSEILECLQRAIHETIHCYSGLPNAEYRPPTISSTRGSIST
jgi:hypothetical protein